MLKVFDSFSQDGQIKLGELPQEVSDHTQVLVTFLESERVNPDKLR